MNRGRVATPEQEIAARLPRSVMIQIAAGVAAAVIATGIRYALPLEPNQVPMATIVIAVALVTTFFGLRAGIVAAVTGGLAAWYLFLNPLSWSLASQAWVPLLGYVVVVTAILTAAHLYRRSEQGHHQREVDQLRANAESSRLFARELAHRLGNTLAIVQSIAVQTIGRATPESAKFVARLQALSEANQLLTAHIDMPTASVTDVIKSALKPFGGELSQFEVESVDAKIKSPQVLYLVLSLHELCTNAVKYGALSTPLGSIGISVTDEGEHLRLIWKEQDGPAVCPPGHQGFGTKLLSHAGLSADLAFESEGLRCEMRVPKGQQT